MDFTGKVAIVTGGANGIGPNLNGVAGSAVGAHAAGFAYSDTLVGMAADVWSPENLDAFLESPKGYAPGTKMTFAGLGNPEERANLILYLNSQGSNLPLPPPPAADAAAAAPAAAADAATGEPTATPTTDAATQAPAAPVAK